MNKFFQIIALLCMALDVFGQQGYPKYYEMMALKNKADSLYKVKDYRNAALYYSIAAKHNVEKVFDLDYAEMHYNAACAWALAKRADNSFIELNLIGSKMNYSNYEQLVNDSSLIYLHTDKRWSKICKRTKANAEVKEFNEKYIKSRTTFQGKETEILFKPHTAKMREYIDNDSFPFISINYSNFRIYFRGNSYTANHFAEVKQQVALALQRILSVLQTSNYNKGLNLILVDSAGELGQLTNMYVHGGFSLQEQDLIFIVNNGERKIALKHEVFHFISNDVWGYTESRLLNEGGAVFTENECYDFENPVYSISAYLLTQEKIFSFKSLINNFDAVALENEVIAYYESAAIFKYLYERYGVEKIKQLWLKGFSSFESIYKMTLTHLEKEWTDFISTIQPPKNLDWEKLRKHGC